MAAALEAGIEWLRPLANSQPWHYCIIWKLGDDPSRFIEWGACCCSSGRRAVGIKIKGQNQCKDSLIKHPIRSHACRKLAQLPSALPLYSGIHGDVVISKLPRWTTGDEPNGTQVLIPVTWGLIELFTTKLVPRDQNIIDYISARFSGPLKQESVMENAEISYQQNCPGPSFHYPNLGHYISPPTNYSSFEGSSSCSSLSNDHQLVQLGTDHHHVLSGVSLEKSSKDYVDSPSRNLRLRRKKCADNFAFANVDEKVGAKTRQKMEKGPFKSKNLMTERNRRKRIKDRELALRALVPNISKMDKVGILVDAADYIKELVGNIRNYHEELEALEEEEVTAAAERPVLVRDCADEKDGGSEKTPILVGVDVIQLGKKDFLVKIINKQRRGAFSRLMEAFDCLGLEVADANVTTHHGLVSNVLTVEALRADLDPNTVKHSLVELVN